MDNKSDSILFDDGYLLLSDNVSKLPSELLIDRVGTNTGVTWYLKSTGLSHLNDKFVLVREKK